MEARKLERYHLFEERGRRIREEEEFRTGGIKGEKMKQYVVF